jgi:intracellular multiplication protein IcmV
MGFWSGVGKVFNPVTNFSQYVGLRRIAEGAGVIVGLIKWLLTPAKAERKETFDEAIERLNLTEKDLEARTKEFKRLVYIMCTVSLFALFYAIYLFLTLNILGALAATVLTSLACAMTFKYHFWLFQIRKRRLGCTIREWFREGLLRMPK